MAYRDGLDAVHARCEDLAARIAELERATVRRLEARLRARLVVLEACKLHAIELAPATPQVAPMLFVPASVAAPRVSRRAACESVVHRCDELCARLEAMQHLPVERRDCETLDDALSWEARLRAEKPPRFTLTAGNVVSARAHVGVRCTIRIDRSGEGCNIDAICPTVEKRFQMERCTTEEARTVEVELDAWR